MPVRPAIDALVLSNDLAPTIADLAGAQVSRSVDGSSLLPLLESALPVPWRKRFLIEHFGLTESPLEIPTYGAIRTGSDAGLLRDLVYTAYQDEGESRELYDITADPFELRSLHRDPSAPRRLQRQLLDRWLGQLRECREGSCRELEFR
jgi:arylsulfatase A-like enzyme